MMYKYGVRSALNSLFNQSLGGGDAANDVAYLIAAFNLQAVRAVVREILRLQCLL